jgi:hypothetical protein
MKSPKEAGPHFEAGEVEKWYQSNGWVYPVKIPAASGLAAVQQFFEALGFTKPPRVEINTQEIVLEGSPGEKLSASVEVSTPDKKPVYAHGSADVPWLEVGRARCSGRTATIGMTVPRVPNKPGERLETQLIVQANGNRRFTVPVIINVKGSRIDFTADEVVEEAEAAEPVELVSAAATAAFTSTPEADNDLDFNAPPPPLPRREQESEPEPVRHSRRKSGGTVGMGHLVPAVLLGLAVLGVVAYDLLRPKEKDVLEGGTSSGGQGWNYDIKKLRNPVPRLAVEFTKDQRFGIRLRDSNVKDRERWKKLTYDPQGKSNNTVIKIDESEYYFGFRTNDNVWVGRTQKELPAPRTGWESTMLFKQEQVQVTQHVEVVPSDTALLDTLLIYYTVHNASTAPHTVGVRILLDTYIGARDDVPFTVPGRKGFVTHDEEFTGSAIPDYVEAIENDMPVEKDKKFDPGTTVRINLKGIKLPGIELVEPNKLRICKLPGQNPRWSWPLSKDEEKGENKKPFDGDSVVAVYWPEKEMAAKSTEHMAITYGLGSLDVGDQLAVSTPASVIPGREFTVTVYVWDAKKGQKVKLDVPEGMSLASGEKAEKTIDADAGRTQVFWRVQATKAGTFTVEATSKNAKRGRVVEVKSSSIFG